MPVIPVLNRDLDEVRKEFNDKINEPRHQRNLVLIIVCIALLLDNMLYMVIVPIIPQYLQAIDEANAASTAAARIRTTTMPYSTSSATIAKLVTPVVLVKDTGPGGGSDDDEEENNSDSPATQSTKKSSKKPGRARSKDKESTTKITNPPTTAPPSTKKDDDDDDDDSEDVVVGFLFASKALVQLLVNPFSGAFIDRIGYDVPMCIGLGIIFVSTLTFSFGGSYFVLFLARSLQGVGSAFADTSGLAMIADRFTEEGERSKALGIALAFISFGSLFAPPFGGFLYEYIGQRIPFVLLAMLALFDGLMLILVMRPHKIAMTLHEDRSHKPKGTPIWKLFQDPYIAVCAGALVMANVSLAFLEPTIAIWMKQTMKASESQIGFVWLPGFIPHLLGVLFTVWMSKRFPQYQWALAAGGLALEGASCFLIPFCTNYWAIMIPISGICFGIALVDTAILPTLGYLVDVRHTSVYGSIYAIADISYSLAYAFGPIVAGNFMHAFGFTALNMTICVTNLAYAPVIYFLRYFYEFKPLESNELSAISNQQSAIGSAGFRRFVNDDGGDNDFNQDYTSIDTGMDYQQSYQTAGGGGAGGARPHVNKPESAQFQNMQKYPRKQHKNPYKDTNNLMDNMDEEE